MRGFWEAADRIIRSTRLAHDTGYDVERNAKAETARERRTPEIAEASAPTVSIETSPMSDVDQIAEGRLAWERIKGRERSTWEDWLCHRRSLGPRPRRGDAEGEDEQACGHQL
jgi:hypothetical protein